MEKLPVYGIGSFEGSKSFHGQFYVSSFSEHVQAHDFVPHPHRHDFYILLYITHGSGTHNIDFISYAVEPGALFLLVPGQVHSWTLSDDIEGFILFFSREFLEGYFIKKVSSYIILHGRIQLLSLRQHQNIIVPLLQAIHQECNSLVPSSADIVRDYLDILLLKATQLGIPDTPSAIETSNWQLRELERLIDENYLSHSSPSFYAEQLHISVKYLNALCQKYLQKTTSSLIQERIILEAKRMLAHHEYSVKEIAARLNFEDYSYFIRYFRKATGMTPQEFRGSI